MAQPIPQPIKLMVDDHGFRAVATRRQVVMMRKEQQLDPRGRGSYCQKHCVAPSQLHAGHSAVDSFAPTCSVYKPYKHTHPPPTLTTALLFSVLSIPTGYLRPPRAYCALTSSTLSFN